MAKQRKSRRLYDAVNLLNTSQKYKKVLVKVVFKRK